MKALQDLHPSLYSDSLLDYRLLGLVGQGQFAQVYCAVHRRTGRLVAIKQIRHIRIATSKKTEQLNTKEATLLQQFDHPNILKCHAASKQRLILDYCEAGSLRSHLSTAFSSQLTARRLSFPVIKRIVEDILKGLSYLHQHGIVHSDLKPENILLTMPIPHQLTAKLSDFGCAHPVDQPNQSTLDIGSPYYAAPERFNGQSSVASDLYSVGIMLYELLIGDRPFSGTHQQLRQTHESQLPHFPGDLHPAAKALLSTALHKQPDRRFASASSMLEALETLETPRVLEKNLIRADSEAVLPKKQTVDLATVNLSKSARPIPAYGITAPVESLATLPQGCCIVTEKSLHILTPKRRLMSMARFKQPCWISVSPNGKWFVALPKDNLSKSSLSKSNSFSSNSPEVGLKRGSQRQVTGMIGKLSLRSGHQWRRSITLTSRLLTALLSTVLQVIAIDSRYFLQIRTATEPARTYLECFTGRGQFVGELRFNQSIAQVAATATPYQLIAIGESGPSAPSALLLINLKPFQIRTVRLPFVPRRVHALNWGIIVVGDHMTVLLDRNAQPVTLLQGLPDSRAIASLDNRRLLLANHAIQPSLSVIDASTLDLGLIF